MYVRKTRELLNTPHPNARQHGTRWSGWVTILSKGRTSETILVLCPRLILSVLVLLRKTCTYPRTRYQLPYVKHPYACFGNSSISHTQDDLPARPRGVHPPKWYAGRLLCGQDVLHIIIVLTWGIYSEFFPFSPKKRPGAFNTIGAFYSRYYSIMCTLIPGGFALDGLLDKQSVVTDSEWSHITRLRLGGLLVNLSPVAQRTNPLTNGVFGRTMGRWSWVRISRPPWKRFLKKSEFPHVKNLINHSPWVPRDYKRTPE